MTRRNVCLGGSASTVPFVVTVLDGIEDLLATECKEIGLATRPRRPGTLSGKAELLRLAHLAMTTRFASRILVELAEFECSGREALYRGASTVDWKSVMTASSSFAVRVKSAPRTSFSSTQFVALVIKDAIVDQFRNQAGTRPRIDVRSPEVTVVAHVGPKRVTLLVDLVGAPTTRREDRAATVIAPLGASLAAALVVESGFRGEGVFVDAMTGSGTIAIEAARSARGIGPRLSTPLALETWPAIDPGLRDEIRSLRVRLQGEVRAHGPTEIWAFDKARESIRAAKANAAAAGFASDIRIEPWDATRLPEPPEGATIALNPPYGARLGDREPEELYAAFIDRLRGFPRHRLAVISPGSTFAKHVGRPPDIRRAVHNGGMPCSIQVWKQGMSQR